MKINIKNSFKSNQKIRFIKRRFRRIFIKTTLITISFLPLLTLASFRLDPYIEVEKGKITNGGIMADDTESVYAEIFENINVLKQNTKTPYQGDILPPQITAPALEKPPRGRMDHLISFEILSGDGSPIYFLDQFDHIPYRQSVIKLSKNPQINTRLYGIKIFIQLPKDPSPSKPALYYFEEEKQTWQRIGGGANTTSGNPHIFSAQIKKSGRYSLFDENPLPRYNSPTNPEEIIPVGTDPYTFAQQQIQNLQINQELANLEQELQQNSFFEQENNSQSIPPSQIIPAITTPQEDELEQKIKKDAEKIGINQKDIDPQNPENTKIKIPLPTDQNTLNTKITQENNIPSRLPTTGKTLHTPPNLSFPWGIAIALLIIITSICITKKSQKNI